MKQRKTDNGKKKKENLALYNRNRLLNEMQHCINMSGKKWL